MVSEYQKKDPMSIQLIRFRPLSTGFSMELKALLVIVHQVRPLLKNAPAKDYLWARKNVRAVAMQRKTLLIISDLVCRKFQKKKKL